MLPLYEGCLFCRLSRGRRKTRPHISEPYLQEEDATLPDKQTCSAPLPLWIPPLYGRNRCDRFRQRTCPTSAPRDMRFEARDRNSPWKESRYGENSGYRCPYYYLPFSADCRRMPECTILPKDNRIYEMPSLSINSNLVKIGKKCKK